MKDILDWLKKFFGVGFQLQTYLNLVYLTLALPLGIIYFVVLTAGFATGLGMSIILVGVFILLLMLALAWALAALERQLAIWLLRVNIGPMERRAQAPGFWDWLQAYLGNPVTWSGLLFLFLKLPIGVIVFSATVTLLSLSVALLLAPFTYAWLPLTFFFWRVDTLPQALTLFVVGLFVTALSLHLLNFLAGVLGRWAQMLLGSAAPASTAPAPANRPASGSCLVPCVVVALFACVACLICTAVIWPWFGLRPEPVHTVVTVEATSQVTDTPTQAASALPSATPSPKATDTPAATSTASPSATTTAVATDTSTPIPPTATLPTATLSAAAATAVVTLPPTNTPTPAGPAPMANAGSVLFEETFAPAKYYWGTGENQFSRLASADGALTMTVKQPKRVVWTFSGAPIKPDFYFSGVVTATTCTSGDNFGLVFRAQDDRSLFLYGVSCDGRYQLTQYIDGAGHPLVAPTESAAILSGPGAANQLGVRAVGKQIDLYVNGQFLATTMADTAGQGMFGVYAASAQTPGLAVAFSQLKAWEIKP